MLRFGESRMKLTSIMPSSSSIDEVNLLPRDSHSQTLYQCVSLTLQRYDIGEGGITCILRHPQTSLDKATQTDSFLRFAQVFYDQGDLLWSKELGVRRHAAVLQRPGQRLVATYPVVEVAQCSTGCDSIGEIQEGKFRFAVLLNLEHNQVDFE